MHKLIHVTQVMNWKEKALDILEDSLYPVAVELNELDWKSGLSCKTERLAQHLCAFSNLKGGGILFFGVNDDATFSSMTKEACDDIIKKLGNIAKNNLSSSISVEHWTTDYKGHALLFIHISEQMDKPIHLRGKEIWDSYTRSAGQTVKSEMTKQEKIEACYQHACLVYEDNRAINNQSVRERFGIDKNQSSVASRIIADTLESKKSYPMKI